MNLIQHHMTSCSVNVLDEPNVRLGCLSEYTEAFRPNVRVCHEQDIGTSVTYTYPHVVSGEVGICSAFTSYVQMGRGSLQTNSEAGMLNTRVSYGGEPSLFRTDRPLSEIGMT